MYSDEDGIATRRSQSAYHARIKLLSIATILLSWFGFGITIAKGEYARENLKFTSPLHQVNFLHWNKFLWPLLCFNSLDLQLKNDPISIYTTGLRGSLLSIIIVCSKLLAWDMLDGGFSSLKSLESAQVYTAIFLAVIQVLFPRRPDVFTPEGKLVDLERSSSALGKYSMHWCTAALALAGRPVPLDELPVLDYRSRSKTQPLLVIKSRKTTLWDKILFERFAGLVKQWTLMLVRSVVTFGSPYCVMQLLKSLEGTDRRPIDAWVWLVGLVVSSACETIINHHLIWIQWSEMGIPIRGQLIMAIFQKALRKKDSKAQSKTASNSPEPISLISSDATSFSMFTAVNYIIPSSFIRFFFAMVFLLQLLGWRSALAGVTATILSVPVHTFIINQQRVARKNLTATRDKKAKAIAEGLHALRQIKFSALEPQWEKYIETLRQEEIRHLQWSYTASNIRSVWAVAAPFFVAAASICTYANLQGAMSPSTMFPMIEVLPHLQGTLGFVPVVFQDYFGARSNARRIEGFLRLPEQRKILGSSPTGCVSFQNASIAWPSDDGEHRKENSNPSSNRFSLEDINLEFPVGELSVISGKTGSGKSLLLSAIIGEVELLGGRINAPSIADHLSVAYVSQPPWLQNATIRDNILYGSAFDEKRYEMVLTACALRPDLAALPKGDETEIGLRGVKISGGQRIRVAFGRALYSDAQLLVLDDIFSALDAHVSKEIFNALTGELGKDRTRILVTHQVSLCLPMVKYLVYVQKNTISYAGSPSVAGSAIEVIETDSSMQSQPSLGANSESGANKNASKVKPIEKKTTRSNGRSDLNVYLGYFTAAGGLGFTLVYLSGLVAKQLLSTLTTWILGRINPRRPRETPVISNTFLPSAPNGILQKYLYSYFSVSLLAIIFELLFNLHVFSGSLRASNILFRKITFKVMRMPLIWLDTTPIGEMLRVFMVETRLVDDKLLVTLSEFADSLVKLMTVIGIGLYTSIYTSLLTIALLIWCANISRGYIKARSMVKRADIGPWADILEHFTSSAAGLSTIRAFGAVGRSIDQMHLHVDRISTARRHFWIFNRWMGLQMSFIGILFSAGTGAILLSSKSVIDSSLVGFSLTFAMQFSKAIVTAVNSFGILETFMDAAGAIIQYADLTTEDQDGNEVPEDWPSRGKVEVNGLEVAYSANLPLVLKGVSFTAESGQKIGVVGRTGAGKSSLTLCLLRLLEPRNGSILIDGINISTIKLNSLRSRIAFIPQDPVLFSGTVGSNLDYFGQVSEAKLKEALLRVKLLAAKEDHRSGRFTLDSQISEGGTNISQGQRQLLCLARVLIKNPKIIILDEATSAVDNKTDLLIQDTIRSEFSGTLIVVAHRLRTIATFDRVMVMSDGKVAEFGKLAEVLKRKGLFYNLVQDSQDKDFLTSVLQN